jgi:hypothetical protein
MTMTKEQAIEHWTSLQKRIEAGAYEERSSHHYETNTWPEDGVEESLANLETWAAKQGLEFCWHADSKTWSLEPIEQWRQESVDEAMQRRDQFQAMQEKE